MVKKKITKATFKKAMVDCNCFVGDMAKQLKCDTRTVFKFRKDNTDISEMFEQYKRDRHKTLIQKAENGLEAALDKKLAWAITFVLKNLAKEDYSEKIITENTTMEVIKPVIKKTVK